MFWPFTVRINCSSDLKNFANSRPSASNFKSFSQSQEQFFLTVGQNNFGNKIPFLHGKILHILQIVSKRSQILGLRFFLKTKLLNFNIKLRCHNSKLSYSSLCLLYYSAYYILLGHQHARNNQTKRVMDDGLFLHLAELYQHRLLKCSVWPWLSCD